MGRRKNGISVRLCAVLVLLSLAVGGCGMERTETPETVEGAVKDGQESEVEQTAEEENPAESGRTTEGDSGKGEKRTQYTIGISMPDTSIERWEKDGRDMQKQLTDAGYEVVLEDAGGNIEKQREDIAALLKKNPDLLIVGAVDGDGLGDVLDKAAEQSVKVIAYDKLLMNTDAVDYYVSFDHYKIGKEQAEFIIALFGLNEDMIDGTEHFTMRLFAEDRQDLQSFYLYQGMEDTLISYMWGDKPVLELVEGKQGTADVRLEQCPEKAQMDAGDKYIVRVAVGNGNYTKKAEGEQIFYEDSRREAEMTCLLAAELLEKGTVSEAFLENLDDTCRFDRHSYDNGTGIIPAFLMEAEMIPEASAKLR